MLEFDSPLRAKVEQGLFPTKLELIFWQPGEVGSFIFRDVKTGTDPKTVVFHAGHFGAGIPPSEMPIIM